MGRFNVSGSLSKAMSTIKSAPGKVQQSVNSGFSNLKANTGSLSSMVPSEVSNKINEFKSGLKDLPSSVGSGDILSKLDSFAGTSNTEMASKLNGVLGSGNINNLDISKMADMSGIDLSSIEGFDSIASSKDADLNKIMAQAKSEMDKVAKDAQGQLPTDGGDIFNFEAK